MEADTNYDLNTHADIEELSCFPDEKEVLFFPFSAFGILDFTYDSEKNRHNMKLIYLGKFIKGFELKNKFDIERDELPDVYFKTLFKKSGLIDENIINKMKVRDYSKIIKRFDIDTELKPKTPKLKTHTSDFCILI